MAKLNPVFSGIRVEENVESYASVKGVAVKTLVLLGIAVLSGYLSIVYFGEFILTNTFAYFGCFIGAFIAAIVGQTSPKAAPVASVIYAALEGVVLSLLSFIFEASISGIVLSAVMITATIFGVMLILYLTNIVRATERFMRVLFVIGVSMLVVSLIYLISYLINPTNVLILALTNNPGLLLLIAGLTLVYAAFMLVFDFEKVKTIVSHGFDKRYEWTAALGMMVTIVWIYVEVLRILAIFARRD